MRGHATFLPCPRCGAASGERCRSLFAPYAETSRPHVRRRKPTREHGSAAGYRRHLARGETACVECREAQARYMREYRTDPTVRAQTAAENKARSRALWRLAASHRQEFAALVREEMSNQFPTEESA